MNAVDAKASIATRRALQGFVLPVWLGAGLADWWCHRRTDIEHTAGATESAIHAAMMIEGGLLTMLGLSCEVNAGLLALTYAALSVHELTAVWDVAYADERREVAPVEQHVHGFLERVPMMATLMMTVLHWDQARAVVGIGGDPDWRIRPKRRPLSIRYCVGVLGAVAAFLALPTATSSSDACAPGPTETRGPDARRRAGFAAVRRGSSTAWTRNSTSGFRPRSNVRRRSRRPPPNTPGPATATARARSRRNSSR